MPYKLLQNNTAQARLGQYSYPLNLLAHSQGEG